MEQLEIDKAFLHHQESLIGADAWIPRPESLGEEIYYLLKNILPEQYFF